MPANFRSELRKSCTVETKVQLRLDGNRPYLMVFGDVELEALKTETADRAHAALARGEEFDRLSYDSAIFMGIDEMTLDSAGRFAIPRDVRECAGISDAIFVTGANSVIQLWDPQRFLDFDGPKHPVIESLCRKFLAEVEVKRKAKA